MTDGGRRSGAFVQATPGDVWHRADGGCCGRRPQPGDDWWTTGVMPASRLCQGERLRGPVGVGFQCELCRATVAATVDAHQVSCPACGHTVDVGVYVPEGELRELAGA